MDSSEEIWNGEKTTAYLRKKRLTQLFGAWHLIKCTTPEVENYWWLDEHTAAICIEQYLRLRGEIMCRYGIKDRIQRAKIAGLLAQAILMFPPIKNKQGSPPDCSLSRINERLALALGMSICAEGNSEQFRTLRSQPLFSKWYESQIHYLGQRTVHECESLIMFFEALSLAYFPENLVGE